MTKTKLRIKTVFDVGIALLVLILLSPLFLFAAIIIKVFSPGPIFFRQERIGFGGESFSIFKFRTMHVDSDRTLTGSVSVRNDPRVFVGAGFLRLTKIDELPQILNVLNGTMSLVGPRPTVAEDFERMSTEQRRRVDVKPGLTGLAQVRGNTSLLWPERIVLDLSYIDEYSFWLDLKILMETALLLVTFRADTHPQGNDEWVAT
ncbi:MAG: sugar transferase [Planctomycetaceae bacterium]|nr:sugar transferase [Planctomycetaceae bacterium]